MDTFSKEKRSEIMSKIRSQDTKIETLIRKMLFQKGYRFRKNFKALPGSPDIVLKKYKLVIFIHGCFWHGHTPCILFRLPKSNIIYWETKIKRNQTRDKANKRELRKMGWKVVTVWECRLRKDIGREFARLEKLLKIDLDDK